MGTVLIVEDYLPALEMLKATFRGRPYGIKTATTFQEFMDLLPGLGMPLVALVDENFPGGNGAQAAEILREKIPGVKLISTSGMQDRDITWKPDARFQKPVSLIDLVLKVREFMGN